MNSSVRPSFLVSSSFTQPISRAALLAVVVLGAALLPTDASAQIVVGGSGSNTTDSSVYSGTQTLTKNGTNTVTLTSVSSYTGGTIINAGTLAIGSSNRLADAGAVTINSGGTFDLGVHGDYIGTLTLNGNATVNGSSNLGQFILTTGLSGTPSFKTLTANGAGNLITSNIGISSQWGGVGGNANLRFNVVGANDSLTVTGVIADKSFDGGGNATSGALTKLGDGALVLTGNNSYSGGATITAGTVQIGNGGTTGNITGNNAGISNSGRLIINRSDGFGLGNIVSGTGSLIQAGAGTTTVSAANTYTGGTTISAGTLLLSAANRLADTGAVTVSGGNFNLGGFTETVGIVTLNGGTISNGTLTGSAYAAESGSSTAILAGSAALTKTGTGTLTLGAANTYTGGTNINAGSLLLSAANRLADSGAVTVSGGTFDLGGFTETVGAVTISGGTIANGTLTGSAYAAQSGNVTAILAGNGALTKTGTGTFTLTAANTYSGGTTVSAGRLVVTTTSLPGAVTNNAELEFAQATTGTFGSAITGTGSLVKSGSGALTLSGANTYSGGTTVSAGRLIGTAATLQGAITNNAEVEFAQSSNGTQSGSISGTGSFIKSGNGTLTISGANTYSGGTIISGGRLIGTAVSLQGSITNNAEVEFAQTTNATQTGSISGTGSLIKSGSGSLTLSGTNTYSGGTTVSAGRLIGNATSLQGAITNNAELEFAQTGNGTASTAIGGTGYLIKSGAGTLTLSGTNSFTGGTTVSAGTLATSTANRLASTGTMTVGASGTFRIGGDQTLASLDGSGNVQLGDYTLSMGSTTSSFSGNISGNGALTKVGAGTLTLSGTNTFLGDTTISAGTLVLASSTALHRDSVVSLASGSTLTVNQRTFIGALEQGGGTVNGTGELVSTLTLTESGALNSVLADGADFAAGVLKRTAGVTTVGAANTFTGTVKIQGGTLRLAEGGSFASGASLTLFSGATLDLNGKSQAFSDINGTGGTITLGSGTLTLDNAAAATFAGVISGTGSLVKSDTGSLSLTGTNTFTGSTDVDAGLLTVNGSLAGAVNVDSGAVLGGSGTVGSVAVAAGGSLTPGNSPGILSTGDLALDGTLAIEVAGTVAGVGGYDQVNVAGTVTLGAGSILNLTALDGFSPALGTILFIVVNDGTDAVLGTFNGLTHSQYLNFEGMTWQISYAAHYQGEDTIGGVSLGTFDGGNDIALVAIPEPSTYGLVLGVLTLALAAVRRRRKAPCV